TGTRLGTQSCNACDVALLFPFQGSLVAFLFIKDFARRSLRMRRTQKEKVLARMRDAPAQHTRVELETLCHEVAVCKLTSSIMIQHELMTACPGFDLRIRVDDVADWIYYR